MPPGSPALFASHQLLLAGAAALVWIAPDFGQIFRGTWQYTELRSGVRPPPVHWSERFARFEPNARWGLVAGAALLVALLALVSQGEASRFIYVQF